MKRYATLLFAIFYTGFFMSVNGQIITTFAGTGAPGYNGDGISCATAMLDTPYGVAVDKQHNVYISDTRGNRIRKVNSSGIISTIAGTGLSGYSGDYGPATAATIDLPSGIFIDDTGSVFFADWNNHRIRKIDTAGIITTVAGNGIGGYSGNNGPATLAQLFHPSDVVVDSMGNIFISEYDGNQIRKVNLSGIITIIAGTSVAGYNGDYIPATSAQFSYPIGLTVDDSGNIYVADTYNQRVRKISTSGIITTIAGTGIGGYNGDWRLATTAQVYGPVSVKIDKTGNIYISESAGSRIRKINSIGVITTIAGNGKLGFSGDNGPAISAKFYNLEGIAIDDSVNMYIADASNNRIRRIAQVLDVGNITNGELSIVIAPNPNQGSFTVNVSSVISQQVQVIITNTLGQKVKEYEGHTNEALDMNINAPPGIYFIKINGSETRKFIKN